MKGVFMLVIVSLGICVTICKRRNSSTKTPYTKTTSLIHFSSQGATEATSTCYKYCCNCNGEKTECTGKGRHITYLPRAAAKTRLFRMWLADLRTLTSHMLANLSNFDIDTLDLARNNISHVEKDSFKEFTKLTKLIVSGNPIPVADLKQAFFSMAKVLDKIEMGNMGLYHLPEDFFEGFANRTFSVIDLQNNNLAVLDNSVFAKLWRIDTLDISRNKISSVRLTQRARVPKLKLEWDVLSEFPMLCLQRASTRQNETDEDRGEEMESAFINLKWLYLAIYNKIPRLRGKCLPNLEWLDISANANVVALDDNFIADLPVLTFLIVSHMSGLKHYSRFAFNSSSLKTLMLVSNGALDGKSKLLQPGQLFRLCPNLESLTITETKLGIHESDFIPMLLPLKSLQTLTLNTISFGNIPEDFLWRLPNLKKLVYTGNRMTSKGLERALINVTTLESLNVQANSITVVSETTLPWEFRRNVKEINLAQNPFTCTCDLLWFRKWLDDVEGNKSIRVINYPSARQYQCRTPEALKYKALSDFHPTDETCAIKKPYIVFGLVIGCLVVVCTVVGGLCYRYRWHLRFYIYRLRRRTRYLQGFERNVDGGGETVQVNNYDIYLAHCAKDVDWINDELLPVVEGEHNLKTFVDGRDTVGGYEGGSSRYMDDSARIMLVLSDHYNHEGWRNWEFEHILYSAFEFHKDVIVILLGEVEAGRMTKDMRNMLTRGTFLQWGSSKDAKRHFREGLKVALKTRDTSFAQTSC